MDQHEAVTPQPINYPQQVFLYLLAYRWASLLPAIWLLPSRLGAAPEDRTWVALLAVALANTVLITLFHKTLNCQLLARPALLGVDLLFTAALIALSGGANSPYYLYALSPLLAGALFFQMRGAWLSALVFTPLYLAALWVNQLFGLDTGRSGAPAAEFAFMQLAGAWSMALLFGYTSVLLKRLKQAYNQLSAARDDLSHQNQELSTAHRQLKIIHDLTLSLQVAPDVESVQRQVLQLVTSELGYPRAAAGLVNPTTDSLEGWQSLPAAGAPPGEGNCLPLLPNSGPLVEALLDGRPRWFREGEPLTSSPSLDGWLGEGPWLLLPLILRDHPVGAVLLASETDWNGLTDVQCSMLQSMSSQAAVSLGTTMLCIDRARRLAVEQERNRIARDIHDTVAQSLFGIIFSLDACIRMLPEHTETVREELVDLKALASQVRDEVRRSILDIWPSRLTLERFKADLSEYVSNCCRPRAFQVEFASSGDFDRLSPAVRRTLYRVTQEALVNAARHAGTDGAQVSLRIGSDRATLSIQDRGRGFDSDLILSRSVDREHFGLRGVQERVEALAGSCEIISRPGNGTEINIQLPLFEGM